MYIIFFTEYKISFEPDDLKLFSTNNYRAKNKKFSKPTNSELKPKGSGRYSEFEIACPAG